MQSTGTVERKVFLVKYWKTGNIFILNPTVEEFNRYMDNEVNTEDSYLWRLRITAHYSVNPRIEDYKGDDLPDVVLELCKSEDVIYNITGLCDFIK